MAAKLLRTQLALDGKGTLAQDKAGRPLDGDIIAMKALTHPLRVHILLRALTIGRISPTAYASQEGEKLSLVSYHVKILKEYGALELVDTQPRRGATEHFYSVVRDSPIVQSLLVSTTVPAEDGTVGQIFASGSGLGDAASQLFTLRLDKVGRRELKDALTEFPERLRKIEAKALERTRKLSRPNEIHIGIASFRLDPRPTQSDKSNE